LQSPPHAKSGAKGRPILDQRKDATEATKAANARLAASLPKDAGEDFANATRGFLGAIPDAAVAGAWSLAPFALVIGETTLDKALADGAVSGEGVGVLGRLLPLLDRFDFWFEIVAP
jgi:alkyl sulfatase BDS1-like metallo-beta-lactamase superfamily hydrolase